MAISVLQYFDTNTPLLSTVVTTINQTIHVSPPPPNATTIIIITNPSIIIFLCLSFFYLQGLLLFLVF